jgi:hypothetical protein
MKQLLLLVFSIGLFSYVNAQTPTYERVYNIMQTNCATAYCHGSGGGSTGLDLEGTGNTTAEKMTDVYNKLVGVIPTNTTAAAKGDHLVYKGRMDKSFLFRKINNGIESTVSLDANEGNAMPSSGTGLTDVEKELIRQWILHGAPETGEVVKESILTDYYVNGMANESFPNGAPAPPSPSEGFQIKMGPFFLAPQNNLQGYLDEIEYFQKWELDFANDLEVTRIDTKMGTYSHHFLMYDYDNPNAANALDHGLRTNISHVDISLVEAIQQPTDLLLPEGSAFNWEDDIVLDLNTHYINYDANTVHKAEVYINVYTQPTGTANQEMQTFLIANPNIYIPNNGNPYSFSQYINPNLGELYLWSIMGHTHQWGSSYTVHERVNGQKGDMIYDAACPQGAPNCATPFFDYQHIPMRFFDELLPVTFSTANGIIHEASYINTGPNAVGWGDTSDDEMMVLVFMGVSDTTGVVTNTNEIVENPLNEIKVFPNPATQKAVFTVPPTVEEFDFVLFDMLGRQVMNISGLRNNELVVDRKQLEAGIYIYQINDKVGNIKTGKVIFR